MVVPWSSWTQQHLHQGWTQSCYGPNTHKGICQQMALTPINTKSFRTNANQSFLVNLLFILSPFYPLFLLIAFFCMSECSGMGERECEWERFGENLFLENFSQTLSLFYQKHDFYKQFPLRCRLSEPLFFPLFQLQRNPVNWLHGHPLPPREISPHKPCLARTFPWRLEEVKFLAFRPLLCTTSHPPDPPVPSFHCRGSSCQRDCWSTTRKRKRPVEISPQMN